LESNGYYGVAYLHRDKRQVILSHRGNENLGKHLITKVRAKDFEKYNEAISSAITFAHHIVQFGKRNSCEIFFT